MLQKMIKQRVESAELYDEGGRAELAQRRSSSFRLPAGAYANEVKAAIGKAVKDTGAAGMKGQLK